MNWALLRGLGWGSLSSPVPPHSMDRVELSQTRHWAGGRAHTQSCCRACISIYSLSISFMGESKSRHSVCVVFLSFGLEKRWDFSEQILLSPSTAALWVHTVTTWRINLLWREGQSNIFGAAFSPSLERVRHSPHRTWESPGVQDGAGCPWGHHLTVSFGAPTHRCCQHRGWVCRWHRQAMPDVLLFF